MSTPITTTFITGIFCKVLDVSDQVVNNEILQVAKVECHLFGNKITLNIPLTMLQKTSIPLADADSVDIGAVRNYLRFSDPDNTTVRTLNTGINEEQNDSDPRTTICVNHSKSGFVRVETSTCVSSNNYSISIGSSICKDRMENAVWAFLGELLLLCKTHK